MIFNTHKKNVDELKNVCESVFTELRNNEISLSSLEFIKQRIIDNWELSFDDLEERAEFIAGSEIYQLTEYSTKQIKEKIKGVTPKTLCQTFSQIYNKGYTVLTYQPA